MIVDDGNQAWRQHPDGTREFIPNHTVQINGEDLYRFDEKTGVLHASIAKADMDRIIAASGGLPIRELRLPGLLGEQRFPNVTAVRELPRSDGSFMIRFRGETSICAAVPRKRLLEQLRDLINW